MVTVAVFVTLYIWHIATGTEVCHPPYGCFNDTEPYNRPLGQLPQSPKDVNTVFTLHTRQKQNIEMNPLVPDSPRKANFHPNKTTVLLTHGYIESKEQWYVQMMIDELLAYEDMNVIFVDWSGGSGFPYHQVYGNVRLVGRQIAKMVQVIRTDTGMVWSKFRMVGFSIGAHVVGYAGRNLREMGLLVPRITVLDPAAPLYEYQHADTRIDPTDADFVDVIHTDTNTLVVLGFGAEQIMGHLDIYPNGGFYQPGCEKFDVGVVQYLACSHYRSVRYYIESINSKECTYRAYAAKSFYDFKKKKFYCPPDGCPVMGYHATKPSQANATKYFLMTGTEYPYCSIHYLLKFETDSRFLASFVGEVTVKLLGTNLTEDLIIPRQHYNSNSVTVVISLGKKDVGVLNQVEVSHNRLIDIWYLKAFSVTEMWSGNEYTACYFSWLNSPNKRRSLIKGGTTLCTNDHQHVP